MLTTPLHFILRFRMSSVILLLSHSRRKQGHLHFTCVTWTWLTCLRIRFSFLIWPNSPQWAKASSFTRFLDHTQLRTTFSRTPLNKWSARRRDLYLTTHIIHNRQTSMPPVGFEPTISAGERPQTYALDRTATETGFRIRYISGIMGQCIYVYLFN